MKGQVFLIPVVISEETQNDVLPNQIGEAINACDLFLVENVRTVVVLSVA